MVFTALSDEQVNAILENLTLEELQDTRKNLAFALHEFSTNTQAADNGVYQQPHRITTLNSETKATSLYMPSCGPEGMACKIVSLTTSDITKDPSVKPISPTGVVNLFTPAGKPLGLIHASTLTAFRTALASACLLFKRSTVRTLVVFGAGSQAYWHVRLALMLRGSTIRKVHVVNHRFSEHAGQILKRFSLVSSEVKRREGWDHAEFSMLTPAFHDYERLLNEHLLAADVIYCCTPSRHDLFSGEILTSHEARRKGRLIVAVGSFTPEMRELPEELLKQATKHHGSHRHFHKHADEGGVIVVDTLEGALKEAGEIISAQIGPNQLVELGELVMLHRIKAEESETDTINSTTSGQTSDSDRVPGPEGRTPSMASVYGSTTTGSKGDSSPRSPSPTASRSSFSLPFRKRSDSPASTEKRKKEDGLARWLRDGTVIYKSVGLGLMDLVVGNDLIRLAAEKGVGTQIPGF